MSKLRFPPRSTEEFAAWLKYQKEELLALPLVPRAVMLGGKELKLPEELRIAIAQSDHFVREIVPRIEGWLYERHPERFAQAGGVYEICQ